MVDWISIAEPQLEYIADELAAQTDRGAAIIACALLDDLLSDVLKARLILTGRTADRLFSHENNGVLASLSAKIDIAFAVGVVSPGVKDSLHVIRRIRNRFAHSTTALKFDDQEIASWCSTLSHVPKDVKDPRSKFIHEATSIAFVLLIFRNVEMRLPDITIDSEVGARAIRLVSAKLNKFSIKSGQSPLPELPEHEA